MQSVTGKISTLFHGTELLKRIASAVILAPLVLYLIYSGGYGYSVLITLAMLLMGWEWVRLWSKPAVSKRVYAAFSSTCLLLTATAIAHYHEAFFLEAMIVALVLTAIWFFIIFMRSTGNPLRWGFLGILYVTLPCISLLFIRNYGDDKTGMMLTFYLMAVVWATDIGAYFAGRIIGGPKIAPKISPKKTWAGLIGGSILAVIGALFVLKLSDFQISAWQVALASVLLAVVSQMGDFFESWVKRYFGVKDSGNIIPGHGGILDRVDGLLFASVLLAAIITIG